MHPTTPSLNTRPVCGFSPEGSGLNFPAQVKRRERRSAYLNINSAQPETEFTVTRINFSSYECFIGRVDSSRRGRIGIAHRRAPGVPVQTLAVGYLWRSNAGPQRERQHRGTGRPLRGLHLPYWTRAAGQVRWMEAAHGKVNAGDLRWVKVSEIMWDSTISLLGMF